MSQNVPYNLFWIQGPIMCHPLYLVVLLLESPLIWNASPAMFACLFRALDDTDICVESWASCFPEFSFILK